MSAPFIDDSCFLCGAKSTYRETDYGNRRAYNCENKDCGQYEISKSAMSRIEDNVDEKNRMMQKAKECAVKDGILEIYISNDKSLIAECRKR